MVTIPPFLTACIVFSAISFLFFGYSCLTSRFMKQEFERYGLSPYRGLTGVLQIAGALSLLGGFYYLPLAITGSGGLTVLMSLGLGVRIKLRDSLFQAAPAFFYALLNLLIALMLLQISP